MKTVLLFLLLTISIAGHTQAKIKSYSRYVPNHAIIGQWKLNNGVYEFGVMNRSTCTAEIEINYNGTFVSVILDITDGEKKIVTLKPNEWYYFSKSDTVFNCYVRANTLCTTYDDNFWIDIGSDISDVKGIRVQKMKTKITIKNCKGDILK
jgi:hypothetical protein